ncbi:MAG: ribonuclease J [Deltaproteobacteria bacterium]|jgi:ribonuclease J|nr:ribonuclease J [Deltaproteobacteria bacterium]
MSSTDPSLNIIPLGGLGEIGLNCLALEWAGQILVIDVGLMFPEDSRLGVELVIPDFSYLIERKDHILGIILTHGHEDHIGALSYLLKEIQAPVFGTRLTLALARERALENYPGKVDFRGIKPLDTLTLGPFSLEFISVSHSIVDGVALAITTPVGVVIHTGDFKLDLMAPSDNRLDLYKFAQYGEKGVLLLLSDSTNAEVPGQSKSESEVGRSLRDIFQKAPGRVILACFASSVARIRQVAQAAQATNRKLLFEGRSMVGNVQLAQELGYLEIPPNQIVNMMEADSLEDHELAVVVTGSQGEPLSALARMAAGEHRHIQARSGDSIILSARAIPGNERAIGHLVNQFHSQGANVVDYRRHQIHASGHAQAEELKLMLNLTRPQYFTPIHGEYRHLARHAELALEHGLAPENIFILTDGQTLGLTLDRKATLGEVVPTGRWYVDGDRLASPGDPVIKNRSRLAEMGLAVITLVYGPKWIAGEPNLLAPPEASLFGVHYETDPDLSLEAALEAKAVWDGFLESRDRRPLSLDERDYLVDLIKKAIRRLFKRSLRRKPLVHVQLIEAYNPRNNWES